MFKRIIVFIIAAIIILIPFSSMADVNNTLIDGVSEKADRTEKQGDKAVNKASNRLSEDSIVVKDPDKMLIDLDGDKSKNTDVDKSIKDISKGTYSLAWRVLIEFQRNSFPVCLIGIIIGALITNILGPRNMIKKKLGVSLMFGFLSFWVIAQIAPVIFWLLIQ